MLLRPFIYEPGTTSEMLKAHPLKRIGVYERTIRYLKNPENDFDYGLCWLMNYPAFDTSLRAFKEQQGAFPELMILKPAKTWRDGYWFKAGDRESRIKLLEKAIELCKQNLK